MKTRRNRGSLGQAMVETVLGLLVFVTVLLIGIHFAEVGYMALKVQEAANFGLWDVTARPMHNTFVAPAGRWDLWKDSVPQAIDATHDRYEDYEGLTTEDSPGGVIQVLTSSTPLTINCGEDPLVPFQDVAAQVSQLSTVFPTASANSGMSCQVQADLIGVGIPRVFMDQQPFRADHWTPQSIPVCSAGRPSGGNCTGRHAILLDDWGFSGPQEGLQCRSRELFETGTCPNTGYYNIVRTVFEAADTFGNTAGSDLARLVTGGAVTPCDENLAFMSFVGSEGVNDNDLDDPAFDDDEDDEDGVPEDWDGNGDSPFKEHLGRAHHTRRWETTPFELIPNYRNSYNGRENCFLGQKCDLN